MSLASHAKKFSAPPTDAAGRIPLIGLSPDDERRDAEGDDASAS